MDESDGGPRMKEILLVDDDEVLRELMRLVLEDEGYALTECVDGQEALGEILRRRFDLVIADLRMPVMDGARFLKEAQNQGAEIPPVIVFSGSSGDDVEEALGRLPVSLVLRKPVDPDSLVSAIQQLI